MNPTPFEYHKVSSVQEAIGLLQRYPDEGKILAGGHSLLPVMKLRLAQPGRLIDITGLSDLSGVTEDGGAIHIGALMTHHEIERDETLQRLCPILPETATRVGDRQVRNRGTIGGTLAHADPAADFPAAILALDAELVAHGPNGERTIPASEFFLGFLTSALNPDELLTEIRIPTPKPRTGMNYQKLANQASGYAVVGVAAVITLDTDGTCAEARIGITGAADHATRATAVEDALRGQKLDDATIRAAADHATDGLDVLDDLHASADYRLGVTKGLTRRAITAAVERVTAGS